jgi:hypothetical protein
MPAAQPIQILSREIAKRVDEMRGNKRGAREYAGNGSLANSHSKFTSSRILHFQFLSLPIRID